MIHDAGQIRIREGNAAVRIVAQDFSRSGLPIGAKEKSGLGAEIGVAPPVQNDAGDIAPRVESGLENIIANCSRMRRS